MFFCYTYVLCGPTQHIKKQQLVMTLYLTYFTVFIVTNHSKKAYYYKSFVDLSDPTMNMQAYLLITFSPKRPVL